MIWRNKVKENIKLNLFLSFKKVKKLLPITANLIQQKYERYVRKNISLQKRSLKLLIKLY